MFGVMVPFKNVQFLVLSRLSGLGWIHLELIHECMVQVICTKVRDGDKRIVRLKEGSPKGRHVVIVDDLVQSGGTLIECQRLLKTQVQT